MSVSQKQTWEAGQPPTLQHNSGSYQPTSEYGGDKEIRTPDLFIANEPLYQLSYTPTLSTLHFRTLLAQSTTPRFALMRAAR